MSAIDLFERLEGTDVAGITSLQRILLITDGTLTEILEAHFLERIELVKLSERVLTFDGVRAPFSLGAGEAVLERRINLRGARTGTKYVYAESFILVDRLDPSLRMELIETNVPLGRLWRHHRLETYKQLVGIDCRPARELSHHLGCAEDSPVLARTFDVFSSRRLVMRISEFFCATANG